MNVMQLLLKRYKRRVNKVIKGGSILSILFSLIISLAIPPFNIYANSQNTIIVPTWDSSTTQSQWDTHLTVENYCEGTNVSTNSCKLMFTVDSNYYGYIYFDGYVGNTKWIDFKMVFIADGYGEYNYNLWSNGQISINNVNIAIINLVQPDTTVDLTQIIQLLTAIESDTNSIESYTSQTLNQIRSVLSQLIISNGYLETLSKLKNWNIPIESYNFNIFLFNKNYTLKNFNTYNYFNYPVFEIPANADIYRYSLASGYYARVIFATSLNIYNQTTFENYFSFSNAHVTEYKRISQIIYDTGIYGYIYSVQILIDNNDSNAVFKSNTKNDFIGIYFGYDPNIYEQFNFISTDFALNFGLTNRLLNDLNIIANGTLQSNQSSSDLDNQTSSFDTTSNSLYSSENAFNTDMNSKLQSIDTSFNPSTSFGSKFLSSADWVRTQFNNLTSTSPFGTVLSFSMLLGLSLLIIGKVFK